LAMEEAIHEDNSAGAVLDNIPGDRKKDLKFE